VLSEDLTLSRNMWSFGYKGLHGEFKLSLRILNTGSSLLSDAEHKSIEISTRKVEEFLGVKLPHPEVHRISDQGYGMYLEGVILYGPTGDEEVDERILIHELAHLAQNIYCRPRFPVLHALVEGIPLILGLRRGKLLRFLQFTEGFATWVEESIMGERGESYWLSLPVFYRVVYYEGKKKFERMGRDLGIRYGLGEGEFCRRLTSH
jgi:hypothetical protein